MAFSQYSGHIPRCQHIKTNGTQCGSPALRRRRFCYFHNRWRATRLDLNRAGALRVTSTVELPVLEDADSIQVALMQVLRLILCRQLDSKTGGLMLYGLQTASSNLHHLDFDHRHKPDVIIDPRSVAKNGVGDEAWSPEDFEEEEECTPEYENENKDHKDHVETAASAVRQAKPDATDAPVARTSPEPQSKASRPATEAMSSVAPTCPESLSEEPSPAKAATTNEARQPARTSIPEVSEPDEVKDLQRVQTALQGAERGNWRDLKTVFEIAGIYPPKDHAPSESEAG